MIGETSGLSHVSIPGLGIAKPAVFPQIPKRPLWKVPGAFFFEPTRIATAMEESAITHSVEVRVEAYFLEEQSDAEKGLFTFAYRVKLKNLGQDTVQLLRRHWVITDSTGHVRHVKGDGVVGEQPVLQPGQSYEYVSGSRLESPIGSMEGTYQMVNQKGESFEVKIPQFTLAVPSVLN